MSENSTREYTEKMRCRYRRVTGKPARGRLLDEYVAVTGFDRKYSIKVLRGSRRQESGGKRRGAPRRYDGEVDGSLRTLWLAMDQPSGKRMKDMLPLWIGHSTHCQQTPAHRGLLGAVNSIQALLDQLVCCDPSAGRTRINGNSFWQWV